MRFETRFSLILVQAYVMMEKYFICGNPTKSTIYTAQITLKRFVTAGVLRQVGFAFNINGAVPQVVVERWRPGKL